MSLSKGFRGTSGYFTGEIPLEEGYSVLVPIQVGRKVHLLVGNSRLSNFPLELMKNTTRVMHKILILFENSEIQWKVLDRQRVFQ